jgi:phosphonate metabolism protein PhnN/1,5-bisphosphokinase (PRPP-forming)
VPYFRGQLVLVVGPSGAGKDSIIRAAQGMFSGDPSICFPKRVITRQVDEQTEDHESMSRSDFIKAVERDSFAVWWEAHGHAYGIPSKIEDDLEVGRTVVFNCSRAALTAAAERYPYVIVVEITAPVDVLVSRIVARGRETPDEAEVRVARKVPPFPSGIPVVRINNAGSLASAIADFCSVMTALKRASAYPGENIFDDQNQDEYGDHDGEDRIFPIDAHR